MLLNPINFAIWLQWTTISSSPLQQDCKRKNDLFNKTCFTFPLTRFPFHAYLLLFSLFFFFFFYPTPTPLPPLLLLFFFFFFSFVLPQPTPTPSNQTTITNTTSTPLPLSEHTHIEPTLLSLTKPKNPILKPIFSSQNRRFKGEDQVSIWVRLKLHGLSNGLLDFVLGQGFCGFCIAITSLSQVHH